MKKRIFVGISIPEHTQKLLTQSCKEWQDLPISWTKQDSLHVTVLFIGSATDEEAVEICDNVRQIAREHNPFDLEFNKLDVNSRMVWATGQESKELAGLKNSLERQIFEMHPRHIIHAENPIIPHITLGRIRTLFWKKLENPPEIKKDLKFLIPVDSIEVMESKATKEGMEYVVLESVLL